MVTRFINQLRALQLNQYRLRTAKGQIFSSSGNALVVTVKLQGENMRCMFSYQLWLRTERYERVSIHAPPYLVFC